MTLITIGLVLDLMGVVIIFFFGIPPKIDSQEYFVTGNTDKNEEDKLKRYKTLSHIGLFFLMLGFVLQIVGNID